MVAVSASRQFDVQPDVGRVGLGGGFGGDAGGPAGDGDQVQAVLHVAQCQARA